MRYENEEPRSKFSQTLGHTYRSQHRLLLMGTWCSSRFSLCHQISPYAHPYRARKVLKNQRSNTVHRFRTIFPSCGLSKFRYLIYSTRLRILRDGSINRLTIWTETRWRYRIFTKEEEKPWLFIVFTKSCVLFFYVGSRVMFWINFPTVEKVIKWVLGMAENIVSTDFDTGSSTVVGKNGKVSSIFPERVDAFKERSAIIRIFSERPTNWIEILWDHRVKWNFWIVFFENSKRRVIVCWYLRRWRKSWIFWKRIFNSESSRIYVLTDRQRRSEERMRCIDLMLRILRILCFCWVQEPEDWVSILSRRYSDHFRQWLESSNGSSSSDVRIVLVNSERYVVTFSCYHDYKYYITENHPNNSARLHIQRILTPKTGTRLETHHEYTRG